MDGRRRRDGGRQRGRDLPQHLRLQPAAADDDVPARLPDADQLRQLRQLLRQRAGRARRSRRAVVIEPERDRAGHGAHGSPVLGELRGGHARALGPDRGAVHRPDESRRAHWRTSRACRSVPSRTRRRRHAVAQWCESALLAAGQRGDVVQHAERAQSTRTARAPARSARTSPKAQLHSRSATTTTTSATRSRRRGT